MTNIIKKESTVKNATIEIYYPDDLYYGQIRVKYFGLLVLSEADAREQVEQRLPFFKNKKYSVSIS